MSSPYSDSNNLLDSRVAKVFSNAKNENENFYGTVLCFDKHFETYTVQFDDGNYMDHFSEADVLNMIENFKLQGIH
jgi:hypothetical protein